MEELERLQKRYQREKIARLEAEQLLEQKSRELFLANQTLKDVVKNLEKAINENTHELVNARNKAQEAEQTKGRFIANISHELLTPMNGIQGNLALMDSNNFPEKDKSFLQQARSSSDQMLKLIQQIIEYAQLQQFKLKLNPQPFSLLPLIDDLVAFYQPLAEQKKCHFSISTQSLPDTLIGDSERIREIIVSILDNAVKFTETGKIELDIQYQFPHLRTELRDTGIGISQENIALISEAFNKADESHSRAQGGIGLGLTKAQQLIQAMDGKFKISSQEGFGTDIQIDIPLISPMQLNEPIKNTRVLVVDDNPVNQQILKDLLEQRGYALDLANNGFEAFTKSEEKIYSIILMDIQMPVMDGLEATRKIRAESRLNHSTPIVAVTAHCTEEDEKSSLEAGMNAHLLKPINHYELLLTIHQFTHQDDNVKSEDLATELEQSDIPIIDGIDTASALPRVNNNSELFKKILLIFLHNNYNSYQNLFDAINTGRIEDGILISHSLKGSAATIGADSLSKIAAIIEQHLRKHKIDSALEKMELLRIEHDRVITSLESVAEKISSVVTSKNIFDADVALEIIKAVKTHLFDDLSKTETLVNNMLLIDFPSVYQPIITRIKLEYEQFNLIELENLLDQLNQMIVNSSEHPI